jgi:hypothetical protein
MGHVIGGKLSALITCSPLPPLLLLTLSGMYLSGRRTSAAVGRSFLMAQVADPMSDAVDTKIASLSDWRGALLTRIRVLIKQAVPGVVEEVKWRKPTNPLGVPTWSLGGIICTGESYTDKVKLTFPKGSSMSDPHGLFNASLTGVRRALDIREDEQLDEPALQELFREAAAMNAAGAPR